MEKETKPMLPESPRLPMEFLSRSWSLPALQLSKALSSSLSLPSLLVTKTLSCTTTTTTPATTIPEDNHCDNHHVPGDEDQPVMEEQKRGTSFSFASSSCSSQQLLIDRILSHSVPTPEQVSPMTSGRPSCSEAPTGILGGVTSLTSSHECHHLHQGDPDNLCSSSSTTTTSSCSPDPPFISPSLPFDKPLLSGGRKPTGPTGARTKTVGRWLKDRREKKKEETRVHNAHLHSAVSVAAVAAAVAATAAATAVTSKSGKDEQAEMTDAAVASAATLVAARCVEAAEAMGAARDQLIAAVSSAVNVQSHGDIMTLTAAAATALRGAATLKARMIKEVGNIAAVLPVERGTSFGNGGRTNMSTNATTTNNSQGDDLLGLYSEQLLARGFDLLKRTRKGDLHWKIVSVYINKAGQVILKMKSKHVAGTITKKKKKVLMEVLRDVPEWPERQGEGGEELRYFGVKTITHRVIEFECKNQQEYEIWTEGVSRLLSVMAEKTINHFSRHACIGVDVL